MKDTKIQWADATWNPIWGCSKVSAGCANCYAEKMAHRFSGPGLAYEGLIRDGRWTGEVRLVETRLQDPLRWRKPRRVFVNSMSDLFHDDVPDGYIAAVFAVMSAAPQHQFLILTKRAERMRDWFQWVNADDGVRVIEKGRHQPEWAEMRRMDRVTPDVASRFYRDSPDSHDLDACLHNYDIWPLPNVWLGVSVEDQAAADQRVPELLATPAVVRFVSAEPLLAPVDLVRAVNKLDWLKPASLTPGGLDWVIVGGESGPGARPCNVEWISDMLKHCKGSGTPCFVKQLGTDLASKPPGLRHAKGGDPEEWPEALRVREFPS